MRLKRGLSRLWRYLYKVGFARAPMPFWRVVIEARLDRTARRWPRGYGSAVTAVFVWARTVEEAEGLASLAMAREGLVTLTADAVKCPPAAPPKRVPVAVSRNDLAFLARDGDETDAGGAPRRDARA
jgi:hypothetical protein